MDIPLARDWIATVARTVAEQADYLTQLDSAIGDADHGVNLNRGFTAVTDGAGRVRGDHRRRRVRPDRLRRWCHGWAGRPGRCTARRCGRSARRCRVARCGRAPARRRRCGPGWKGCSGSGAAVPGDKTIVDAYVPALEAYDKDLDGGRRPGRRAAPPRRPRPRRACGPPPRCRRARAGRPTWARAASATRTRARPRPG